MFQSSQTSPASSLNSFVEADGCARSVLVILLITTVGCMSYTWGYYEGITNVNSMIVLDELHRNAELAQLTSVEMDRDSGGMAPSTGSLLKGTNNSIWSNNMRAKLTASKNATGLSKGRGNGTRLNGGEPKLNRENHKRARHQAQQADRQAATTERDVSFR